MPAWPENTYAQFLSAQLVANVFAQYIDWLNDKYERQPDLPPTRIPIMYDDEDY